jgi:hypothetical protein
MRKMAGLQPVPGGDKFAWEIQTQLGDTIFGAIAGKNKSKKMTASASTETLKEQHFNTYVSKKPRSKICANCEHYKPRSRFCGLNNWPVEKEDSCDRFSRIPEDANQSTSE